MSWDAVLYTELDGQEVVIDDSFNYTHNTNPMIRQAGFDEWNHEQLSGGVPCEWFCERLACALACMNSEPDAYRAMNPSNKWGDFDHLRSVLQKMLASFDRYPSAKVRVSF